MDWINQRHQHMKSVPLVVCLAVLVCDAHANSFRGLNQAADVAMGDPFVVTEEPTRQLQETTFRCPKWAHWCRRTRPPTTMPPTNLPTIPPTMDPPTTPPPTKVTVAPTTTPTRQSAVEAWATQLLIAVNKERDNAGLKPLCLNAKLNAAAQAHAQDMADKNYFDHSSLDGTDPFTRIERQGYQGGSAENIAAGYATVELVMDGWMKSPGHRANILGDSNQLGVGTATNSNSKYGTYWVQDFGKSTTEPCL